MRRLDLWSVGLLAVLVGLVLLPRLLPRFVAVTRADLTPEERAILGRMAMVLTRDDILPIYEPRFVPADRARLRDDELVLGVELNGDARAYPITTLNTREMVNDVVGDVPILATW